MVRFYLLRMERARDARAYLETTVAASMRDAVRAAWDAAHPESPLG